MIDESLHAEIGRRSWTDIVLGAAGTVQAFTAHLWFDPKEFAASVLLYGSAFLVVVRLYGLGKDWLRGRRQRRAEKAVQP